MPRIRIARTVGGVRYSCTLIAAEVVERNIARMAHYCRERGIALRPHTKTHSRSGSPIQLEAGAVGLTVAKPAKQT